MNPLDEPKESGAPARWNPSRWDLIRDAVVFQVKLVVDGMRDLILLPVSVVAALMSLLHSGDRAGSEFYRLVALGKRTEKWINLFGAAEHLPEPSDDDAFAGQSLDKLVGKVESMVREQYDKGGVTAQAKEAIDSVLDTLPKRKRRGGE